MTCDNVAEDDWTVHILLLYNTKLDTEYFKMWDKIDIILKELQSLSLLPI